MTKYSTLALEISAKLGLDVPPIAVSFTEAAPPGVQTFEHEVPSACTFWRKAEAHVFYVPAAKHFNCPIGAMTMGFEMPGDVQDNLMQVVQKMFGAGYISPEETGKIPSVKKKKSGIVYGPLKDFPVEADLILMWLTPQQAMLYSEAAGICRWTENLPAAVFGRPSCAALPIALENRQSTFSLGCAGMRIFTEISDDRILAVLPGGKAQDFVKGLEVVGNANASMQTFYEEHKAKFVE